MSLKSPLILFKLACMNPVYFSLKQVNNGKCITAVRGSL